MVEKIGERKGGKYLERGEIFLWRRKEFREEKKLVGEKNNEEGLEENIWRRRNVFLAEKVQELVANDHPEGPASCT